LLRARENEYFVIISVRFLEFMYVMRSFPFIVLHLRVLVSIYAILYNNRVRLRVLPPGDLTGQQRQYVEERR